MRRLLTIAMTVVLLTIPASLVRAQGLADGGSPPAGGCLAPGHIIAPPSGFDPLAATGAQLACYGFPARPSNAKELGVWQYYMAHARIYAGGNAPSSMRPFTTIEDVQPNFAGYYAPQAGQGLSSLKWYQAQADWTVPSSVTPNYGHIYDFPTWVGMGGASNGGCSIDQAGSNIDGGTNPNLPTYHFWFEYGLESPIPETTIKPKGGDQIYVSLTFNSNTYITNVYYEDITQNQYKPLAFSTPQPCQTDADFIVEEIPSYYMNFHTVTWSNCFMQGTYGSGGNTAGYIEGYNNVHIRMDNPNNYYKTEASTSEPPNSSTNGFTVTASTSP